MVTQKKLIQQEALVLDLLIHPKLFYFEALCLILADGFNWFSAA